MREKKAYSRELSILRKAASKAEKKMGRALVRQPSTQHIIAVVEGFLVEKGLVCYGGTAINNLLPPGSRFYDGHSELPDYDFFSPHALKDAKTLADLYIKEGYQEVEAKASVHYGTYKVFVNFIPVADVTDLPHKLFDALQEKAIVVNGIKYAPPDFLRMSMHQELSRPQGETDRWEKVLQRLFLLNDHFPIKNPRCTSHSFARKFEGDKRAGDKIFHIIKTSAIHQKLVFFGSYATSVYNVASRRTSREPDFDLLSPDPKISAEIMVEALESHGLQKVRMVRYNGLGEIVPPHYQVLVGADVVAFIYETKGCHNYNEVRIDGKRIRIATIDTMLSLYLAFLYVDTPYHDPDRIYCIAQYLFHVQNKHKLRQHGVLKRFVTPCIGTQSTLASIRRKKAEMHRKLSGSRKSAEYERWFLNYAPKATKTRKKRGT